MGSSWNVLCGIYWSVRPTMWLRGSNCCHCYTSAVLEMFQQLVAYTHTHTHSTLCCVIRSAHQSFICQVSGTKGGRRNRTNFSRLLHYSARTSHVCVKTTPPAWFFWGTLTSAHHELGTLYTRWHFATPATFHSHVRKFKMHFLPADHQSIQIAQLQIFTRTKIGSMSTSAFQPRRGRTSVSKETDR